MKTTNQQVLDKLNSLESLLEAGLRECYKTRKMIQGGVSTQPTDQNFKKVDPADINKASRLAVQKRNLLIKTKHINHAHH